MLLGAELWEPGTPTDVNRWQQQILQGVFPSLYILLLRGKEGGVHLLSPRLTQLCLSVPSDKAENGEPYQRRRGVGTPLPDSPPVFPTAKDAALTASSSSWRRILLMILAITIHNIPGKAQLSAWPSIYLSIPLSVHPCTLPGADAELDTAQEDFLGLPSLLPSSLSLLLADGTCQVGSITLHCAVCMGLN